MVEQVARMIDPGAFAEWISTQPLSEVEQARTAYMRSKALCVAVDILKLASQQANLRTQLIEHEMQGWRDLGVPVDHPDCRKVVAAKYAQP